MKKAGLIVVLFIIISCKDNSSINKKAEVLQEPKLEVKNNWSSRFSTLIKIEDRGLKVEDVSNLDKINGFRNAHFNANLDDFTYSDESVKINGYGFEDGLKNHKCASYNSIHLELGSLNVYALANGSLETATLTFLENRLKRISITYVERLLKNGYGERVSINKDDNAKGDYVEISLFKFYKSALGEPTKIYMAEEEEGKYIRGDYFTVNTTLENAIKELDTHDSLDLNLVWETDKTYFKINIIKDRAGLSDAMFTKDKYDDFKVNIDTYIKEDNILQNIENASKVCLEELGDILANEKNKVATEKLKSL